MCFCLQLCCVADVDIPNQFDHTIVLGDLNYRLQALAALQRASLTRSLRAHAGVGRRIGSKAGGETGGCLSDRLG